MDRCFLCMYTNDYPETHKKKNTQKNKTRQEIGWFIGNDLPWDDTRPITVGHQEYSYCNARYAQAYSTPLLFPWTYTVRIWDGRLPLPVSLLLFYQHPCTLRMTEGWAGPHPMNAMNPGNSPVPLQSRSAFAQAHPWYPLSTLCASCTRSVLVFLCELSTMNIYTSQNPATRNFGIETNHVKRWERQPRNTRVNQQKDQITNKDLKDENNKTKQQQIKIGFYIPFEGEILQGIIVCLCIEWE